MRIAARRGLVLRLSLHVAQRGQHVRELGVITRFPDEEADLAAEAKHLGGAAAMLHRVPVAGGRAAPPGIVCFVRRKMGGGVPSPCRSATRKARVKRCEMPRDAGACRRTGRARLRRAPAVLQGIAIALGRAAPPDNGDGGLPLHRLGLRRGHARIVRLIGRW